MLKRLLFTVAIITATSAAHAQATPHPSDLIAQPGYSAAWSGLIAKQRFERRDSWIPKLTGPGSSASYRDPSGGVWIEGNVCHPHNCSDNHLILLFDPRTKKIWAAQRTRGALPKSERFFGNPDAAMRKLLSDRIVANFP
ncbi:Ivy family c-type lysozyme inhibitor [Terrarubrum flagellatum]|uniref:Ivy family c-type lysozyme inhibitor n=1 Tax=Terrirubrum flagellatum TaxID=2895980 RepID=UPI003144E321